MKLLPPWDDATGEQLIDTFTRDDDASIRAVANALISGEKVYFRSSDSVSNYKLAPPPIPLTPANAVVRPIVTPGSTTRSGASKILFSFEVKNVNQSPTEKEKQDDAH